MNVQNHNAKPGKFHKSGTDNATAVQRNTFR
jgi:hypothetical protein